MGKVIKKILGTNRGRVGDIVMRKWRQEIVSAAYQPNPSNPRTQAQQEQRALFAAMSKAATSMAPAIAQTLKYGCKGTNMSPRNMFIKMNKEEGFNQEGLNIIQVPQQWKVAKGRPSPLLTVELDFDNLNEIGISNMGYAPGSMPSGATSHIWFDIVVYCSDAEVVLLSRQQNGVSTATIAVPQNWAGLKCHVWICPYWHGDPIAEMGMENGATFASVYVGAGVIS